MKSALEILDEMDNSNRYTPDGEIKNKDLNTCLMALRKIYRRHQSSGWAFELHTLKEVAKILRGDK